MKKRIKKYLWILLIILSTCYFTTNTEANTIKQIKLLVNDTNIRNNINLSRYLKSKKNVTYLQKNQQLGKLNIKTGKYIAIEQGTNIVYAIYNHKILKTFQITSYRWAAHRGYSGIYCENTARAFTKACKAGAAIIETDVRMSKDGVLYCFHDYSMNGKTTCKKTLEQCTSKELKKIRYYKNNEKICTFATYLNICKKYKIIPWIHIKQSSDDVHNRTCIKKAIYMLKQNGFQNRVGFVNDTLSQMAQRQMNRKCVTNLRRIYDDYSPLTH